MPPDPWSSFAAKTGEEVTRFVHGGEELEKAIETTQKETLLSNQQAPAENLSVDDLESMEV